MKLKDIYSSLIKFGMKNDPRGENVAKGKLKENAKKYNKLSRKEKDVFDKESLTNPYADTRIYNGDLNKDIRRIMVGIDIGGEELLVADRLSQKGKRIDLVLGHHPVGAALFGLNEVMFMQAEILAKYGIPKEIAEKVMKERITNVKNNVNSANATRSVATAKLLGLAFMNAHTVADNCVDTYLQNTLDSRKPKTLKNLADLLTAIPEYKSAAKLKVGPSIIVGKPEDKAGKIFVDMTGGTEGSENIFPRLSQAGISTIVVMHLSQKHIERVKTEYLNVVLAGHISSDNLGMNLLLDSLEKKEKFDIVNCSGFERIRRIK